MEWQDSRFCINCNRPPRPKAMRYLLSDMASEMLAWVELKLKFEVNEKSWLCEKCFNILGDTWSSIQEPEVEDAPATAAMEVDPDPLLVNRILMEDVDIKVEEPQSFVSYDYKVEIDTTKNFSSPGPSGLHTSFEELYYKEPKYLRELRAKGVGEDSDQENKSSDHEPNFDETSVVKGVDEDSDQENKSSDYEPSVSELSSDEIDEDLRVVNSPPLLEGSSLKSGTKCDCCSSVLTKQQYRNVPNGPVKDHIVIRSIANREVSPERVCNGCWTRARKAVMQEKIVRNVTLKQNKDTEEENQSETEIIAIPGYKRFTKSSSRCMVQGCESSNKSRLRIPTYLRIFLLKFYNLYAPECSRVCSEHSREYVRDWSFLKEHNYKTDFSQSDAIEMLNLLREDALRHPE